MKLETRNNLAGTYITISDEQHACDMQKKLFTLGHNWASQRHNLRLYTTGYLVINHCGQIYQEEDRPRNMQEVYFYEGTFNTGPPESLLFVECTPSPKIPMVLTLKQINQILATGKEGGDLRPQCRLIRLLNEQLLKAGVKEL